MLNCRDKNKVKKFNEILALNFENGRPLEIVDGDIDKIESVSFNAITEWIQNQ